MDSLPLSNVRIADFTWAAAGPYSTLLLTTLGAEVIKISSSRARGGFPQQRAAEVDRYLNYGKLGITLDLSTPDGSDLAKRLISVCDVVMENFRPGTMGRFGLDYEALVEVKPDIVMVSSSSLGSQGPHSRYTGFAPIFGTMGGLSHITGYADGIPSELRLVVDYSVGQTAAYAALVGVYHQRATGNGQFIDLASRDAMTMLMGEHVLEAQLNGPNPAPRTGNRDQIMAPHGIYRCKGDDAWITIAVATQDEWESLCGVMGRRGWLQDPRFSDAYARWNNQDELDGEISGWTAEYEPSELMRMLQDKGLAGVPSYSVKDLFEDPHLAERQFSANLGDSTGGEHTVITAPWLLDGIRPLPRRPAPAPGGDNRGIFEDLLGVTSAEVDRLIETGVVS